MTSYGINNGRPHLNSTPRPFPQLAPFFQENCTGFVNNYPVVILFNKSKHFGKNLPMIMTNT